MVTVGNRFTGAVEHFLNPPVKIERDVWRKFWARIAAYPVVEIGDLPAPNQPLPARDRLAARWRTFRESDHLDSTKSRHWRTVLKV